MNILLDLVIVALIASVAFVGYKRGALSAFLSLISGLLALILAFLLSNFFGSFLDSYVFRPALAEPLAEKISAMYAEGSPTTEGLRSLLSSPPDILKKLVGAFGGDAENLAVRQGDTTETIAENLVAPMSRMISYAIAFIVLFIVLGILIRLLVRFLRRFNHVPLVGTVNRVVGLVIGLAEGLVLAWVFCIAFALAVPYLQSLNHPFFSAVDIDSTFIYRFFYSFDPLVYLVGNPK